METTAIEVGVAVMFLVKMLRAWLTTIPGVTLELDGDRVLLLVLLSSVAYALIDGNATGWRDIEVTPEVLRMALAIAITAVGGNELLERVDRRIE